MSGGRSAIGDSLVEAYLGRRGLFEPALVAPGAARNTGGTDPGRSAKIFDEMTGSTGDLLPGWAEIVDGLNAVGRDGLGSLSALVDRLLEDDGVTYTSVGADPTAGPASTGGAQPESWRLDPIPLLVEVSDWAKLEEGITQRSVLLDALLTDIYSSRSTLTAGLVPPELLFADRNYLRPAHGITIPGAHQLFFHAVDICRSADGGFLALGDRTQAPSGAGYAMADRRVVAKVLPELFRRSAPRGLSTFFHTVRGALQAVAPSSADDPRVVVLSPGTHSETAFDQAFLASLLGVPLVQSADLTVRAGRLWMRALGRYEPVDVVVRRVDAAWSDPLDLRPNSALGVVGLTEACRRGTVSVVNTLGSGVLENPGLAAVLPALAERLLGESLKLPSLPSFWCGSASGLSHVLTHFSKMILRPTGGGPSIAPGQLAAAEAQSWGRRVSAEPTRWVGQERAPFSEAPAVGSNGLVAGRVGMRLFSVAHQSGYVVMPGGLGRLVDTGPVAVGPVTVGPVTAGPGGGSGRQSGVPAGPSIAKDVWVRSLRRDPPAIGSGVAEPVSAPGNRASASDVLPLTLPVEMAAAASPRVLEDLFWLGRYAERTEDLTRLLITARELVDTFRFRPDDPGARSVPLLLAAVDAVPATGIAPVPGVDGLPGSLPSSDRPSGDQQSVMRQSVMRALVLDAGTPGTVAQSLAGLHETARAVRDQLSSDTWMVLAGVDRAIAELAAATADAGSVLQATHAAILSGMLALSGLASENMVRDPGWRLMDIGRRVERGQQLVALLRATLTARHAPQVDSILIDSVLAVAESGVTYRRRYRGHVQVGTVVELLLLDDGNPRSLAYQINSISDNLRRLPGASGTSRPERLTEELAATLRRARPDQLDNLDSTGARRQLADFLSAVNDSLRTLAEAVAAQHFWRSRPMLPLGPAIRGGGAG